MNKTTFIHKLFAAIVLSLVLFVSATAIVPAAPVQAASAATIGDNIISTGNQYLGRPYKFGAPSGTSRYFDCSSFVQYVYKKNGISLPRDSRQQSTKGSYVSMNQLRKGDLIFFKSAGSSSNRITHVAIYAGNGKMLHTYGAPGVTYSNFSSYWKARFVSAKRVF